MLQSFRVPQKLFKEIARHFKISSRRNRKLFLQSFGRLFCKPVKRKGSPRSNKQKKRELKKQIKNVLEIHSNIETEQQIWNSNKAVRRPKSAWT